MNNKQKQINNILNHMIDEEAEKLKEIVEKINNPEEILKQ